MDCTFVEVAAAVVVALARLDRNNCLLTWLTMVYAPMSETDANDDDSFAERHA